MVDANIVGCNWIELPAGNYSQRLSTDAIANRSSPAKTSNCQIEVDIAWDKLISHEPQGL